MGMSGLIAVELDKGEMVTLGGGHGVVYTKREVVDFMLCMIGLGEIDDISDLRILEPSCGEGDFVVAIAERIVGNRNMRHSSEVMASVVRAVDTDRRSVSVAKSRVSEVLSVAGYTEVELQNILDTWFVVQDFLLSGDYGEFTHVVGNPPYVRVESIPKDLLGAYRANYSTMTDRADLYIPFFEKSLSLLCDGGRLSFICTDRWVKNRYGRGLRRMISEGFSLEAFIDLYGYDAFDRPVMTYPAITQIRKSKQTEVVVASSEDLSVEHSLRIYESCLGKKRKLDQRKNVVDGERPWLFGSRDEIDLVKGIEGRFPLIESAGCRVFIGAATGANEVYFIDPEVVQIEPSRVVPKITASELRSGELRWDGKYLINTYDGDGVIDLDQYPFLERYMLEHSVRLRGRHVAEKAPARWYKTIDRVYVERAEMPKLLIPDIGESPIAIVDEGVYHPTNSIYYICSDGWDLNALRVVLLSRVGKLFIATYSTKIAKGYLRYQSQHLRKLRIPKWENIDNQLRVEMIRAGREDDRGAFTRLVCELYELSPSERLALGED